MDYQELIFDSATAFKSSQQGYASTDTPQFDLGSGIRNIQGAKVVEVTVPVSWYEWTTDVDTAGLPMNRIFFQTDQSGNSQSIYIDIPVGSYSATALATVLTTLINAPGFVGDLLAIGFIDCGLGTNSVVFDSITNKFAWTFNASTSLVLWMRIFVYEAALGSSLKSGALGLDGGANDFSLTSIVPGDPTIATLTSNYAQVTGPNYLYVCSRQLGPLLKVTPNQDTSSGDNAFRYQTIGYNNPQIAMVPITTNPPGVFTWQDPTHGDVFSTDDVFQLDTLDMYLTLGPYTQTPLRLNGLSFQVKLKIITMSGELTAKRVRAY